MGIGRNVRQPSAAKNHVFLLCAEWPVVDYGRMHLDPHTLAQIIQRIERQMRCPQCGKRVPVDFASVRIVGDDFLLLQLKCETCDAFIVLHASLQGAAAPVPAAEEHDTMQNASSTLTMSENEIKMLQEALGQSGGSFEQLFKKYGSSEKKD